MKLNGWIMRILGLMGTFLRHFARDAQKVRITSRDVVENAESGSDVDDESPSPTPTRVRTVQPPNNEKGVANPAIRAYNKHFDNADEDYLWLRRLFKEINENRVEDSKKKNPNKPFHNGLFKRNYGILDVNPAVSNEEGERSKECRMDQPTVMGIAQDTGPHSNLLEVVVRKQKKMIVFASNPFEQMLVVVILRSFGVWAEAILARHGSEMRTELIRKFNRPLSHWATGGGTLNRSNDVEVLVINFAV